MSTQQEKEEKARKDGNKPDYNADIAKAMGDAAPAPQPGRGFAGNDTTYDNGEGPDHIIGTGTRGTPAGDKAAAQAARDTHGSQMDVTSAGSDDASRRGKQDTVTPKTDNPAKTK